MKKIFTLLCAFFLCIGISFSATYSGGSGTELDPYQIATLTDLQTLSATPSDWGRYFIQTADIDASATSGWNPDGSSGFYGWSPIGNSTTKFTGSYNGQGYFINDLYLNRPNSNMQALFGYASGATLENIGVYDVYSSGQDYVSAIVGYAYYSTISTCSSSGSIQCTWFSAGGIVGQTENSTIENCYSFASISGRGSNGGVIGSMRYGSMVNCYSTGVVVATQSGGGGLVGSVLSPTITNCFWDTETSGQAASAGGVGKTTSELKTEATFTGSGWDFGSIWTMDNRYNSAYPYLQCQNMPNEPRADVKLIESITGNSASVTCEITRLGSTDPTQHGVCWNTTGNPNISDDKTELGVISTLGDFISGITGLTGNTLYYVRAYATNSSGTGYGSQLEFTTALSGDGSESDPYQISKLEDLLLISSDNSFWNKHFIQTADIDASETSTWNSGAGWSPIGNSSSEFTGSYDGQGYTISNLYINRPGTSYQGLFGYTIGAKIQNLNLTDVSIVSGDYSGSLIGATENKDTIINCSSSGNLIGEDRIGGLVGYAKYASVENSYSSVTIKGGDYVGGLIGAQYYGSANASYCIGNVNGVIQVGGMIGRSENATLNNCYASGIVNGNEDIGGFVGLCWSGILNNCYSTGLISGNEDVGGLIGQHITSTYNNCFWDTESSGTSTSGGGTGKTTVEMQTQSTFTNATWDFTNTWAISSRNNGAYPYLQWQNFAQEPMVITRSVENLTINSATIQSEVSSLGDTDPTQHGICWNTTGNPTTADTKTELGALSSPGSFSSDITSLTANTVYYVRSYAINSHGTSYSSQVKLTTLPISSEEPIGSGTGVDPYQIATLSNLFWISENDSRWGFDYIQIADIDASGTSTWYPDGLGGYYGWSVIGNDYIKFTGSYNGQGYELSGIYLNRASENNQGLFGYTSGASIQNLGVINATIIGLENVGALIGSAWDNSNIIKCYTSGSVKGYNRVGGLIGYIREAMVKNDYSICSVDGGGGLIGYLQMSTLANCYSMGSVSGYNNGFISGYSSYLSSVTNSFWDTQSSGVSTSAAGVGKTTAEMKTEATFTGSEWDFVNETVNGVDDVWGINASDNNGYPFLSWQAVPVVTSQSVTEIADVSATGNGNIVELGYYNPSQYGLCWNTTGNSSIADDKTEQGAISLTGAFTSDITGLSPNTTYYARAYATNDAGTSYGEEVLFTTLKHTQSITFNALAVKTYGDAEFDLTATASSGLDVSYTSSDETVATVSGVTVTILKVGSTNITASQLGDNDYYAAANEVQILSVTQKELTVINAVAQNKVYDGATSAVMVGAELSGVVGSDDVSLADYTTGIFAQAIVGTGISVSTSMSISGTDIGNYYLTQPTGILANITQKELTVINVVTTNKIYDGTTTVTLSSAELSGVIGLDDVSLVDYTIGTFSQSTVGTGISIGTSMNLNGIAAGNYLLTQPTSLSANITQKELTVINALADNKVYDGTTNATISGAELSGIVGSDDVNLADHTTGVFAQSTVGTGVSVSTSMSLSGTASSNYLLTQPTGFTANITQKELTVVNAVAQNKVYDATTNAVISGAELSGLVGSDDVNLTDNSTGIFAQSTVATGIYVSTSMSLSGTASSNYLLTQPVITADITQKELTVVNAKAQNKVYDGTTNAVISGAELSGVVGSDDVNLTDNSTGIFAQSTVATGISVSPSMSLSGTASSNYLLIQPVITADITQKVLDVINAVAQNKVYNGTTDAVLSGAELSGVIGSDDVSIADNTTGVFAQSTVSTGVPVSTSMSISGTASSNYLLTQPIGITADITQKELTVINATADNKIYDGTTSAVIVGAELSGVVGLDDVSLTDHTTGTFTQSTIGTDISVGISMNLNGIAAGNYSLTQPTGLIAGITQKELTVINATADNKIYDGATSAVIVGAELSGVVGLDDVSLADHTTGTFVQSTVGTGISINTSMNLNGIATGNYLLTQPTDLSANIAQKELTVINAAAQNKVYDGTTSAVIVGAELLGVVGSDDVGLTNHITGTFSQSTVGNNIVVVTNMNLTGTAASNYLLTQPSGFTTDITQKELTVINSSANKVYDGTTNAVINGAELFGVVGSDDVSLVDHTTGIFTQSTVGTDISISTSMSITGTSSGNYSLSQPIGLTANITTKELTISGSFTVQDKSYDETTTASISENLLTLFGIVTNDDVVLDLVIVFTDANIGSDIPVVIDASTILSGVDAGNYTLSLTGAPTSTANITNQTGINSDLNNSFKVYPNPFKNNISIHNANGLGRVVITNIIGKVMINVNLNGSESHNFETNFPSGIYLVVITDINDNKVVYRMVRE